MSENFNKNRIVKNSLLLYVRMLFTMWLNLWTTRLVLSNLGVDGMGVYGVVGSIVGLVSIFTSGVTNAVQRFINFEAGKENGNANLIFCSSLNIIFIISVIVFVLLECIGVYMLYYSVNMPISRLDTAFWVLQLSIITCVVNLISVPYNALVIAHEKMDAFAVISVIQAILTFIAVFYLYCFANRLLVYSIMMAAISVLVRIIYQVYCHYKFEEADFHVVIDKEILKQIVRFTGISTISGALQVFVSQGIVFVINWTFGVALNAVYNIALQLKNAILSFAFNLFKAISPQIIKTYANNEIEKHKKLVYGGSKLEAYLTYFIIIPFFFKADYIMYLWLGNVPDYTKEFSICIVIISITYALFEPIRSSVLASNRITRFLIVPDTFYLLVLPLGYYVSKITEAPIYLIISIVVMDVLTCILRTYYAVRVSPIETCELLKLVVLPSGLVFCMDMICCSFLSPLFQYKILHLLGFYCINSFLLMFIIFFWGLNKSEKELIFLMFKKYKKKWKK